jgi:hypothetical protein
MKYIGPPFVEKVSIDSSLDGCLLFYTNPQAHLPFKCMIFSMIEGWLVLNLDSCFQNANGFILN